MSASKKRLLTKGRKKLSIRKKISGTVDRPRVTVSRTLQNIAVQAIDDVAQVTLASASTHSKEAKALVEGKGGNVAAAAVIGKRLGEILLEKGINKIVFDRNGLMYHGRVKSLADGIREAGIEF